jgi:hypothetical protein
VWYQINIPFTCADVSIEMCATSENASTAGIVYMPDCNCTSYVIASSVAWIACPSGFNGVTMGWTGVTLPVIYFPAYLINGTGAGIGFDLKITVVECPVCPCAGTETPEGEPTCFDEYVDATNGGCNSSPNVFGTIACGETICGTSGTYLFTGYSYRDTDWFQLITTSPKMFTWTVVGQFPTLAFVLDGTPGCGAPVTIGYMTATACQPATVTTGILPAGTYWFFAAPSVFTGVLCGSPYVATLNCVGVCGTCMGDGNGDNWIDGLDVQSFVDAAVSGGTNDCLDFDGGGTVDTGDIPGFVAALLAGGQCPLPPYCAAGTTNMDEYVGTVTIGTINNVTGYGVGGYEDYTGLSTDVTGGNSYPITVLNGGNLYTADYVYVWVDWDNNHVFDMVTEYQQLTGDGTGTNFTGNVNVPAGQASGDYRMRVRMSYATAIGNPCGTDSFGEVEDYTLHVP